MESQREKHFLVSSKLISLCLASNLTANRVSLVFYPHPHSRCPFTQFRTQWYSLLALPIRLIIQSFPPSFFWTLSSTLSTSYSYFSCTVNHSAWWPTSSHEDFRGCVLHPQQRQYWYSEVLDAPNGVGPLLTEQRRYSSIWEGSGLWITGNE